MSVGRISKTSRQPQWGGPPGLPSGFQLARSTKPRRQTRRSAPLGTRGVTLLELVVVMVIMGLIAGISFPAVSAGLDSVRLASATQSVAAFLNGALNRADRLQQPMEIVIAPKDNLLSLHSTEPGFSRELKLPDGVTLEAVLPALEDDSESGSARRIVLLPGGTVPAIGIQMANRHGARRIVKLDPMTGFPRVESVISK